MPRLRLLPKTDEWPGWRIDAIALLTLAAGFGLRYRAATGSFVNPAEACQALLAAPDALPALWSSALRWPEPPLFLLLLHYARELAPTDLGTRLIPLIAGTLSPWAVYRWLGRVWARLAGLAALAMLCLAPELIHLSAEARADTLALLLMAGALYLLDRAIEASSAWRMAGFTLCLWGAILSDYSAAFFTLGAAAYFFLRSRGERFPGSAWTIWGLSQAGAAALYAALWTAHIRPLRMAAADASGAGGWLRHVCSPPEQNGGLWSLLSGAEHWRFSLPALAPAVPALLLFLAGLYFAWRRSPDGAVWRGRAMVGLLVIPFLGTCGASAAGLFPCGRAEGGAPLALFAATGMAIAIDRLARRWIVPLTLVAAVAFAAWHGVRSPYAGEIVRPDTRKELMDRALDFLKRSVPPGTVILTEGELRVVLAYYLEPDARLPETHGGPSEEAIAGWRLFANRWAFASVEELRPDLRLLRERYGFGPDVRIWVLDGGTRPSLRPYFEQWNRRGELPHLYEFGRAMVAVLTPRGFLWGDPRPEAARESPPASTRAPGSPGRR